MKQDSYTINAPDVVAENFDGQVVILNLATGHYFSLEGLAGKIWPLLASGHGVTSIMASIGAARPELAADAKAFAQRLIDLELVKVCEARAGSQGLDPVDWSGEAPRLEMYADLAELIFSDPIHDVDEQAGWPALRKA